MMVVRLECLIHLDGTNGRIQINCGRDLANEFDAGAGYPGRNRHNVSDTIDTATPMSELAPIYRTEHWADCLYQFCMKPFPAGQACTARIHFAETTFNVVGKRVFNVEINGKKVPSDFDGLQATGGKDKALTKEFCDIAPNGDGKILIRFEDSSADKPEINVMEISSAESGRTMSVKF
jgi:hypothetical protein